MNKLSNIGLASDKSIVLIDKLNNLLANYSVMYQNTRGYHWNIKGANFFELHLKFEELYNNLFIKIDEIAERILTLGGTPAFQFSNYLKETEIKESTDVSKGEQGIQEMLDSLKTLLIKQRAILEIASEAGDEGTNALMSDYIREQEKLIWMYGAYLNK